MLNTFFINWFKKSSLFYFYKNYLYRVEQFKACQLRSAEVSTSHELKKKLSPLKFGTS